MGHVVMVLMIQLRVWRMKKFTKEYPKAFCDKTVFNVNGFPLTIDVKIKG